VAISPNAVSVADVKKNVREIKDRFEARFKKDRDKACETYVTEHSNDVEFFTPAPEDNAKVGLGEKALLGVGFVFLAS
jgi:hypothetical protein